jgi:hypothetical protein
VHAGSRAGMRGGRNARVMVCRRGGGGQRLAWSREASRQAEAEGRTAAEGRLVAAKAEVRGVGGLGHGQGDQAFWRWRAGGLDRGCCA